MNNLEIIKEVKSLINPNRRGGVSHFELDKAMALLAQLEAAQQSVQADGLQPGQMFNPYDLNEVAQIDKLINRRR